MCRVVRVFIRSWGDSLHPTFLAHLLLPSLRKDHYWSTTGVVPVEIVHTDAHTQAAVTVMPARVAPAWNFGSKACRHFHFFWGFFSRGLVATGEEEHAFPFCYYSSKGF